MKRVAVVVINIFILSCISIILIFCIKKSADIENRFISFAAYFLYLFVFITIIYLIYILICYQLFIIKNLIPKTICCSVISFLFSWLISSMYKTTDIINNLFNPSIYPTFISLCVVGIFLPLTEHYLSKHFIKPDVDSKVL